MSIIKLKTLTLKNFKGVKELTVDFSDCTSIKGGNGTGKTSVFDAFTWLMFDKDRLDRQNFDIKTLNSNNEVIHGLQHEVSGILTIDDREVLLAKIHKEKWTKKKGEAAKQFTGHETLHYINEVPVKLSEYKEYINGIINEQLFKLISSPMYFSTSLKWQERRNIVLSIIGDISLENVIKYKSELSPLKALLKGSDIETLKKSLAAQKRKLNSDINSIPYRIDEINKSIVEYDFTELETQLSEYMSKLKEVEEKLYTRIEDEAALYDLKKELKRLELGICKEEKANIKAYYEKLNDCDRDIAKEENIINKMRYRVENNEAEIKTIRSEVALLGDKWDLINKEVLEIPEDSFICPTCKRPLHAENVEIEKLIMLQNFTENKIKRLKEIDGKGIAHKSRFDYLQVEVSDMKGELSSHIATLDKLKETRRDLAATISEFENNVDMKENEENIEINKRIQEIESKLSKSDYESIEVLKAERSELDSRIHEYEKKLAAKEQNEKFKLRIDELLEEERKLAQQIAELEGKELLCDNYIKTKVELLESSINSKFKFVKFKLFSTLINGALDECCEALIDGVPFSSSNTANQINAGLDIINALCSHYGIQAPVFIDNRESINDIIHCNSQVINLIVSKDEKLIVENID
jgi:exonuclease SbcC